MSTLALTRRRWTGSTIAAVSGSALVSLGILSVQGEWGSFGPWPSFAAIVDIVVGLFSIGLLFAARHSPVRVALVLSALVTVSAATTPAAATATLDVILEGDLIAHAAAIGDLIKQEFVRLPHVREVRGMGLLLGLVLDIPAKEVQAAALKQGIILGTSGDPNVLRVMPPMVVTTEDVEHLVTVMSRILTTYSA